MTPAVVLEPAIPDMETPSFYIVMLEVLPIVFRCQMVHFNSQRPDLPQHAEQEPRKPQEQSFRASEMDSVEPKSVTTGVNRALFHLRYS